MVAEVTKDEIRSRSIKILRNCGWKPGDQMGAHSVIELMIQLGISLTNHPATECIYPECGCDFDAKC